MLATEKYFSEVNAELGELENPEHLNTRKAPSQNEMRNG